MLIVTVLLSFSGLVQAAGEFFEFEEMTPLGVELEEAFVGRHGDDLLVIGGMRREGDAMAPNISAFRLSSLGGGWSPVSPLDEHIHGGAAVGTADGVICVGGFADGQPVQNVTRFWVEDGALRNDELPDVPLPLPDAKAAIVAEKLYAISSQAAFRLDLKAENGAWEQLSPLPKGADVLSVVRVGSYLYVFAGTGLNTADAEYAVWKLAGDGTFEKKGTTDHDLTETFAAACGQAHVIFVSGRSSEILAYHTITDRWVVIGELPQTMMPVGIAAQGVTFDVIGRNASVRVKAVAPSTNYGWLDHGVVAVFMIGMLLVGTYLSKREKSSEDYFRGGKRVPWWASGLSLFATGASAISLMAMPGKSFATNWTFMTFSFYTVICALPLSLLIFMPIARRLEVATANEYLERRFNLSLRMGGSIIWSLLQMLGRMAAIMLLPAIAISSITGMEMWLSIVIMGVVTTVYVFLGGLEGVIWTDVLQAIVMIAAVVICAVWALTGLQMSAAEAWAGIQSAGKLHMFDWQVSFVEPCVAIMFLNIFVVSLGQIGDQNFIQRVQCTPNEKDARKAVLTQVAVAVPLNAVLFSLGTILFLYYLEKPHMLSPTIKSDGIFPFFAAQNLPSGLAGLVIAAILAATMSTLSSAMNSVANLGTEDFYRRLSKNATDRGCMILGRVLTLCLGAFGTVAALIMSKTGLGSIWDLYLMIMGMLLGAITGIFTLGVFTRRANSVGAMVGTIASLAAAWYVQKETHLHFLVYPVVGVLTCVIVGYVTSLIVPLKKRDLAGLTVYTLQKRREE